MKKGSKWAIVAISCLLLANIVRACAPEYEATNAHTSNNQTPAYNYREYFESIDEQIEQITGATKESKGLSK